MTRNNTSVVAATSIDNAYISISIITDPIHMIPFIGIIVHISAKSSAISIELICVIYPMLRSIVTKAANAITNFTIGNK